MTDTDYVSYPLALALKKAGFDEPCNYGYSVKLRLESEVSFGEPKMVHSKDPKNYNDNRKGIEKGLQFCSAVPLWQAQKWLREKKNLSVEPYANIVAGFNYGIADLSSFAEEKGGSVGFNSYEQALSAGIEAALELIEKKGE